ncbi:MAG TPA: hypothetical protein VFC07_16650 [Verrucomicrobiae bacterium]|nr:hypothetical protein [Verrucomicrobiae bacterium]
MGGLWAGEQWELNGKRLVFDFQGLALKEGREMRINPHLTAFARIFFWGVKKSKMINSKNRMTNESRSARIAPTNGCRGTCRGRFAIYESKEVANIAELPMTKKIKKLISKTWPNVFGAG